ncbi:MAG: TraB/GumN family protein [Rhodanobacteraceae bacterium]
MSDEGAELALLFNFVPQGEASDRRAQLMTEWRKGDVDAIARQEAHDFRELPFFGERLINQRNRNWIPKIERDLAHRRNYFIVVGARPPRRPEWLARVAPRSRLSRRPVVIGGLEIRQPQRISGAFSACPKR